ncbi:hypothetical protein [Microbacterium luteum]|uniref:hypothetical protein n=1 Tax=Microbacterium luteum TaxID=2782167 RepID=UPI0018894CB8|nr:hypothetical protein [Microbacterium luteum]
MSAPTTFPADFEVTIPMRLWARARGMRPRSRWLDDQTERFAAYYADGPEESADWPAEWAAWVLRAWSQHTHLFNPRGYCICGRTNREEAAR